jgi:hypothetical protein
VKRPTMLMEAMLEQFSIDLGLSVERDVLTLKRRCENEGLGFLTLVLPLLSDALERGLETRRFSCPSNFARHGSLPRFLGGFFNRVFTRSGELRPDAEPDCIFAIRQICRFFKKPKILCDDLRKKIAADRYKEVEDELAVKTPQILRKDIILDKVARIIWSQVFPELDPNDLICRHGPGVTAERHTSNGRYDIRQWYDRWEYCFPADLHAFPNYGFAIGEYEDGAGTSLEKLEYLSVSGEPPVRVVFVPKTMVGPRVIAIEPSSMQFVQQGLMDYIVKRVETHRLTNRSIRFRDQSVNQRLAHDASKCKSLATLDLKDASDRVHMLLVRRIFEGSGILDYLEAARSLHATLPDGRNVILNKFASMGSAICFPVEAMVFYTLIQAAMHLQDGVRPSSSSIRRFSRRIDIYGDDIIIPVDYTDAVVQYLESYALKVNVDKSFRDGFFRESCGADYYNGYAVKPVYSRQIPHDAAREWQAEHVLAWTSTANQFYELGMWHLTQAIRDMLERVLRSPIPRCRSDGEGIFFKSLLFDTDLRWNRDLCGWKQRRIVYQPIKRKDSIDGNANACFNKWGIVNAYGPDRFAVGSNAGSFDSGRGHVHVYDRLTVEASSVWTASRCIRDVPGQQDNQRGTPDWLSVLAHSDVRAIPSSTGGSDTVRGIWSGVLSNTVLEFTHSVKRGGFRPKRRWISLPS